MTLLRRALLGRALLAGAAAVFAAPVLAPSALAKPAVTRIPLADAFLLLDYYLALKPAARDRFYPAYRAVRDKKPTSDVAARIVHRDGSSTPLTLDAAGWVTELPTLEQLKRRDSFEVDGKPFDFSLEMRARVAPAAHMPAADLMAALAQVNAALVSFAGGDSSAVGRLTCIYFPDAGAGRAVTPAGERPLPTFDFPLIGVTPYFEPGRLPGATAVALEKAPSRILLAGPPRK
jgi:hypothetical protein